MPHLNGRKPAAGLVLFDIDGTLLRRAGPHHRQALVDAVRGVAGLETSTESIPVQGMLDRDILAWMLRDAGASVASIRAWMPALVRRAQWIYARSCPRDLSDKVCPGVERLLEELLVAGIPAALVSGNLSRIGWKKMERAGLKRYFRFGSFAELGRTRAELVGLALRKARAHGMIAREAPVALIGDHPNDVQAARQNRVRSVAVATGLSSMEELDAHSPDVLVESMEALSAGKLFG
jgi:phosphoglycolate phosphatase-like HAD superfamily hydrolase